MIFNVTIRAFFILYRNRLPYSDPPYSGYRVLFWDKLSAYHLFLLHNPDDQKQKVTWHSKNCKNALENCFDPLDKNLELKTMTKTKTVQFKYSHKQKTTSDLLKRCESVIKCTCSCASCCFFEILYEQGQKYIKHSFATF